MTNQIEQAFGWAKTESLVLFGGTQVVSVLGVKHTCGRGRESNPWLPPDIKASITPAAVGCKRASRGHWDPRKKANHRKSKAEIR